MVNSVKYFIYSPVSLASNLTMIGSSSIASNLLSLFSSPSLYFLILQLLPGDVLLSCVTPKGPSHKYIGCPFDPPKDGHMYSFGLNRHLGESNTQSAFLNLESALSSGFSPVLVLSNSLGFNGVPSALNKPNIIFLGLYLSYGLSGSSTSGVKLLTPSSSGGNIL